MTHPALTEGRTAVITGTASRRLAGMGMKVCMVDVEASELDSAAADVADRAAVARVKDRVDSGFGDVGFLMNNAATRVGGGVWADEGDWQQAMDANFWDVVNGVRAFVPAMVDSGRPGLVVNTGSKQGITNPPGNAAYNVTKAALKAYTESLQHALRNTEGCRVSAHLLVPGWTTTGKREHKPGAWLPDQVIDVLLDALGRDDFYILCTDDEVTLEMDCKRILWAAGDITENRPALSRWHADFAEAFSAFAP